MLNTDKERHNSWQKPKQKQNQNQNQRRNKKIGPVKVLSFF
jgi:hypothetical protein